MFMQCLTIILQAKFSIRVRTIIMFIRKRNEISSMSFNTEYTKTTRFASYVHTTSVHNSVEQQFWVT